jgi:hypothetical protein
MKLRRFILAPVSYPEALVGAAACPATATTRGRETIGGPSAPPPRRLNCEALPFVPDELIHWNPAFGVERRRPVIFRGIDPQPAPPEGRYGPDAASCAPTSRATSKQPGSRRVLFCSCEVQEQSGIDSKRSA